MVRNVLSRLMRKGTLGSSGLWSFKCVCRATQKGQRWGSLSEASSSPIWAPSEKTCLRGFRPGIRHKPACAATEARSRLEISDIETRGFILSKQRTTKVLIRLRMIRLRGCAVWSAPLLFACGKNRVSQSFPSSSSLARLRGCLRWFLLW